MDTQMGPAPSKMSLEEKIAHILMEDIQAQGGQRLKLRQEPINDDDYDSWDDDNGSDVEKWLPTARAVIRAIDRYRKER